MNNFDENNEEKNNNKDDENPLTEDEIKELNLYTELRRQESMAKYGRDIYAEDRKIGNKKAIDRRNFWDKIFDIYIAIRVYVLFAVLITILALVWGGLAIPTLKSL